MLLGRPLADWGHGMSVGFRSMGSHAPDVLLSGTGSSSFLASIAGFPRPATKIRLLSVPRSTQLLLARRHRRRPRRRRRPTLIQRSATSPTTSTAGQSSKPTQCPSQPIIPTYPCQEQHNRASTRGRRHACPAHHRGLRSSLRRPTGVCSEHSATTTSLDLWQ